MSLFANIAKPVKKDLKVPKPGDKCGICKEEAGDDSFLIKVGRKQVIHCFQCYEDVMDDVLFG
jgi:hypothetical protein